MVTGNPLITESRRLKRLKFSWKLLTLIMKYEPYLRENKLFIDEISTEELGSLQLKNSLNLGVDQKSKSWIKIRVWELMLFPKQRRPLWKGITLEEVDGSIILSLSVFVCKWE